MTGPRVGFLVKAAQDRTVTSRDLTRTSAYRSVAKSMHAAQDAAHGH